MEAAAPFSTDWIKNILTLQDDIDDILWVYLSTNGFFSNIYQVQLKRNAEIIQSVIVKLPSGEKFNQILLSDNEPIIIDDVSWTEFCDNVWLPFSHENEIRAFAALKELDYSNFPAPKYFFGGHSPVTNQRILMIQDLTSMGSPLGKFFEEIIAADLFRRLAHLHAFCLTNRNWKHHFESSDFENIISKFAAFMRKIFTLEDIAKVSPVFADVNSLEVYFHPQIQKKNQQPNSSSTTDFASIPEVFVHGDLFPTNILVNGETVAGILDFQFSHIGKPTEDLVKIASFLDRPETGKSLMLNTYFAELKMLLGEDICFTENDLCHWYDLQFPYALAATLLVFPSDLKSLHNQIDKERLIKRSERIVQLLSMEKSKKS